MRLLIIGALGKMGRQTNEVAKCYGDKCVLLDKVSLSEPDFVINDISLAGEVDAIIDFSVAEDRSAFYDYAAKHKIPYGMFSTFLSKKDYEGLEFVSKKVPVLICTNTSMQVNLLYKMVDDAAKRLEGADVVLTEYHHKTKKDIPSGTARTIISILENDNQNPYINSLRVKDAPGTHSVKFFCDGEVLEIKHIAQNKQVFAKGAIEAVHKLTNKKPQIYHSILEL